MKTAFIDSEDYVYLYIFMFSYFAYFVNPNKIYLYKPFKIMPSETDIAPKATSGWD